MSKGTLSVSPGKPAQILMVLDQPFPPDPRVLNEATTLVEAGFGVKVLSIGPDSRPVSENYRGIEIIRFRLPKELRNKMRGLAGSLPILAWFLGWLIPRVHRRYGFDVVHLHDLYLLGGGLAAARRLKVPVVADLHENWVQVLSQYAWSTRFPGRLFVNIPRWRKLEKRWLDAADQVIVVIKEAEERLAKLGIELSKLTVVPNTIKIGEFARCEIEKNIVEAIRSDFTITYTGGIDLHRGLDTLIRAMPAVLAEGAAQLVIVGDGRIRPELEDLARELGVAEYVLFAGWQPQPRIKSYIAGSHVCMVPHLKSGQTDATIPHKLFHYMYMERPVVVTSCKPLERIVRETSCGLVCESGNPDSMGQSLKCLREDAEARRRMGENGHRAVVDRYNWDATVRPMVQMYKELVR